MIRPEAALVQWLRLRPSKPATRVQIPDAANTSYLLEEALKIRMLRPSSLCALNSGISEKTCFRQSRTPQTGYARFPESSQSFLKQEGLLKAFETRNKPCFAWLSVFQENLRFADAKYLSTAAFPIPEEPIVTTASLPSRSIMRSRSKFRSKLLAKDFNRPVLSKRRPTH